MHSTIVSGFGHMIYCRARGFIWRNAALRVAGTRGCSLGSRSDKLNYSSHVSSSYKLEGHNKLYSFFGEGVTFSNYKAIAS